MGKIPKKKPQHEAEVASLVTLSGIEPELPG